jgi:hypothetical protein
LKHIVEGKIEGGIGMTVRLEKDVSSYWITLQEREDIGY